MESIVKQCITASVSARNKRYSLKESYTHHQVYKFKTKGYRTLADFLSADKKSSLVG